MPRKFDDILKDPRVDADLLRKVAREQGDVYVRAAYTDLRNRGEEYNAQLLLGEKLDEEERGTQVKTIHEIAPAGTNYSVSASRNR